MKRVKGAVERILKILICVQKTMIELLTFKRSKWIRMQRLKPERYQYKKNLFSVLHHKVKKWTLFQGEPPDKRTFQVFLLIVFKISSKDTEPLNHPRFLDCVSLGKPLPEGR